jgi:hypothetical protein
MASIPPEKLTSIARDVAFELRLQWRVERLQAKALEAYPRALRRAATSGLPREQVDRLMHQRIYEIVRNAGKGMEALPSEESKPTPEQIGTALEAFSIEQWITLIDGLDQTDTMALRSYIEQHAGELKQRLGARKVGRIEERAIMRDYDHWLKENRDKLVPITDPHWAGSWREQARQANRVGKGHTATGRSIAELSSDSSIARRLTKRDEQTGREMKVNDREVKRWREQMERLPFEQYADDVGADDPEKRAAALIDWLTMIRKKYQRKS